MRFCQAARERHLAPVMAQANSVTQVSVGVVVYSYERPALLAKCLRSLTTQTHPPAEVIVVAKAWDSPTVEVARSWPAARVVTTGEIDIGSAVNAGLASSRSDVVAFIDDDAEARPDWVESLEKTFADPKIGAAGGRDELHLDGVLVPARPEARVGRITWYGRVFGNHHLGEGPRRDVDVLKGCNMAVRRRMVNGVSPALLGPYTYRWEDDLCAQVRRQRARIVYDPEIRVVHFAARPSAGRVDETSAGRFVWAHNLAFVQFRYLSGWRRVAWLAFSLLVGQPDDPGIIRIVRMRVRWLPAFKGKLAGIRSAARARRGATP